MNPGRVLRVQPVDDDYKESRLRRRAALVFALMALVLAACGGDDGGGTATDGDTPAPAETTAGTTEEAPADATGSTTIAVASSDLGDILADGDGNSLYLFTPDEQGAPTCTDGCAENWPPVEAPASGGDGADDSLLGSAEHPSGVSQVTYNGWPLYYFAGDSAPGDTNGQGVNDVWFVVGPDGEPIQE